MSILSSGFMDDDGPIGPALRFKYRRPSPEPIHDDLFIPPSRRHSHSFRDTDPYTFPRLQESSSQHQNTKQPSPMTTKPIFSSDGYAAIGRFLAVAPKIINERQREVKPKTSQPVEKPKSRPRSDVDPWNFAKLPALRAWQAHGQASNGSNIDPVEIFQPRKAKTGGDNVKKAPRAQKVCNVKNTAIKATPSRRSAAPSPERDGDEDEDEVLMGDMFDDPDVNDEPEEEAAAPEDEPVSQVAWEQKPEAAPEKKNKKRQRQEAKAAAEVVKANQQQVQSHSKNESLTPSAKIAGWDMDPNSKPASDASRSHRGRAGTTKDDNEWGRAASAQGGCDEAWVGADMGGMFEEERESSSHRSRSHRSKDSIVKSGVSFAVDDVQQGDAWEEPRKSGSGGSRKSGSKRSSSRREGSRRDSTAFAMETIPEDEPVVGGWGEEQVWEPSKSASRKDSSSHCSHQSPASEPIEASPRSSRHSSHNSQRSRKTEPAKPSHRSSKHSSHKTHESKDSEPAGPSPPKGSLVSYHVPTVQEVQDISGHWGGDDQKPATKSHSRKSSSSHRPKTSSEEAKAAADPPPSHHSRASKAEPRSYRSKSTEKVNEWIEDVPAPSPKALSLGLSHKSSHKSSHESSHRSYVVAEDTGWENGEVPPDGSVGTGYGAKQASVGADPWDKRTSSSSSTRKKQSPETMGLGVEAWDKRTSSGSSTKADLGVRQVSVRSHVSSRRSWGAPPVSEADGAVRQVSVRSHVSSRRSWGAPPASEAGGGGW